MRVFGTQTGSIFVARTMQGENFLIISIRCNMYDVLSQYEEESNDILNENS